MDAILYIWMQFDYLPCPSTPNFVWSFSFSSQGKNPYLRYFTILAIFFSQVHADGPSTDVVYSPTTLAHKQLMYLNKYSVWEAFEGIRDRGLFPCMCKDTPFGKWCNFPIVLNAFGILYCHSQGLFKYTVYLRFFPSLLAIFFTRTCDFCRYDMEP